MSVTSEVINYLDREEFTDLLEIVTGEPSAAAYRIISRGSAACANIRRMGGEDLSMDSEGVLRSSVENPSPATRAYVRSRIEEARVFMKLETESEDPYFDQAVAFQMVDHYLHEGLPTSWEPGTVSIPCIQGLGGSGKSYLLARIARHAQETGYQVNICCPTHAAKRVLQKSLLELDLKIPVTTCHSALRQLKMTETGVAVFEFIERGFEDLAVGPEDHADLMVVITKASEKQRDAASKKAEAARDDQGVINTQLALQAIQILGFEGLDPRLSFFAPRSINEGSLWLFDEIGMIPAGMIRTVLDGGGMAVAFGDPMQLPPPGKLYHTDAHGTRREDCAADKLISEDYTFHLQRSRRTGDGSPIPGLAAKAFTARNHVEMRKLIRAAAKQHPDIRVFNDLSEVPKQDLLDGITLQFTNQRRFTNNQRVRKIVGFPAKQLMPGDWLIVDSPDDAKEFTQDERLRVIGLEAPEYDDQDPLVIVERDGMEGLETRTIGIRFRDNALNSRNANPEWGEFMRGISGIEYCGGEFWGTDHRPYVTIGHAVTVHKSQGAGFSSVTIDCGDIMGYAGMLPDKHPLPDGSVVENWRRLMYVAITRSRGHVNFILA